MTLQRTLHLTAFLAAAGGAAWLGKVAVIAGTDGRVTHTGAAAGLYVLGALLLAVGASAATLPLAAGRGRLAVAVAAGASPVLFAGSFTGLDAAAGALSTGTGPAWLAEEAGIALTGAVWLAAGVLLARRARGRHARVQGAGAGAHA